MLWRPKHFLAERKWFRVSVVSDELEAKAIIDKVYRFFCSPNRSTPVPTLNDSQFFSFSIVCMYLVLCASPILSLSLSLSVFDILIQGQQIEELYNIPLFFLISSSKIWLCCCRLFPLLISILAVPLTQNFLGISQLDSVSFELQHQWHHLGRWRQKCCTGLFPWRTKEKPLHHLSAWSTEPIRCLLWLRWFFSCFSFFCMLNVVDSLETIQLIT